MVCLFSDPNMETLHEVRFCDVVSKDQNFSTGNVATLEANHLQDTGTFSLTSTDWGLKDGFGLYRSRFSSHGSSSSFFRNSFSFGSQELWNRFSHELKDSFSQRFENSLRVLELQPLLQGLLFWLGPTSSSPLWSGPGWTVLPSPGLRSISQTGDIKETFCILFRKRHLLPCPKLLGHFGREVLGL